MQFKLTVVPSAGADAVDTDVTFASSVAQPNLNFNSGPATVLVGWLSTFSPLLTGTRQVGALSVPIPASAQAGQTYTVQVLKPSGTTDGSTDLAMSGVSGVIAVQELNAPGAAGGPAVGAGAPAPPVAEGGGVAPVPAAPSGPKVGAGAPSGSKLGSAAPPVAGAPAEAVPTVGETPPSGGVPVAPATAAVPAKGAGEQQIAAPTPPSGGAAPAVATAGGEAPTPPKPAAATAAPKRPSPTVKRAAPAQAAAPPAKTGGCHCQLDRPSNSSGALLLIPFAALLGLRRRHRGSGRSI
jgi:MYXO-CTERM domain-containing protein